MAKKKELTDEEKHKQYVEQKARYPIGLLFQVSTLAGTVSFLLLSISGKTDVVTAMFRSFVVFIAFATLGGIVMMAIVNALHDIKMKEVEEKIKQMEEERRMEEERLIQQYEQEMENKRQKLLETHSAKMNHEEPKSSQTTSNQTNQE
jgi:hypothetical protein